MQLANITKTIWDKKSFSYKKFNQELSPLQIDFFAFIASCGVDFTAKNIIDVGAGTGVYTLHLARQANRVLALDVSDLMLNALKQSAIEFHINNVDTMCCDFSDIDCNEKFDIAFLTMSPAIKSNDDLIKFNELGKQKIYMNWNKPRYSSIVNPILDKFNGKKYTSLANTTEAYLKDLRIECKSKILNEKRVVKRSFNEALENVLWHLEINECEFSQGDLIDYLERLQNDGYILDEVNSSMKVLVF